MIAEQIDWIEQTAHRQAIASERLARDVEQRRSSFEGPRLRPSACRGAQAFAEGGVV